MGSRLPGAGVPSLLVELFGSRRSVFSFVLMKSKHVQKVVKQPSFTLRMYKQAVNQKEDQAGFHNFTKAALAAWTLDADNVLALQVEKKKRGGSVGAKREGGKLSIIPQDPVLFSGTLRHNLDPLGQLTDEHIRAGLRRCGLTGRLAGEEQAAGGLDAGGCFRQEHTHSRSAAENCFGSCSAVSGFIFTVAASRPFRSHRKSRVIISNPMQPTPHMSTPSPYDSWFITSGAR